MDRATRIARAIGRAHDRLRPIFLRTQCLKLLEGDQNNWTDTASYDSHWYLDKREYTELPSGKRYMKLTVEDVEGCRLAKLKTATAIQVGDVVFKFHAKDSFVGAVPSYRFKVYPIGPR